MGFVCSVGWFYFVLFLFGGSFICGGGAGGRWLNFAFSGVVHTPQSAACYHQGKVLLLSLLSPQSNPSNLPCVLCSIVCVRVLIYTEGTILDISCFFLFPT